MTALGPTAPDAASRGASLAALEPEAASNESDRERKPQSRSYRKALRSWALLLFRLGLAAVTMAVWRIANDLGLPLPFVFSNGMFSHWQVWFGLAVSLLGSAGLLARRLRFGRARDAQSTDRAQAA